MSKWALVLLAACLVLVSVMVRDALGHDPGGWQPLGFVGYSAPFGFEGQNYTDVWGDNGHAYLGTLESGVAILDVTNAESPLHVGTYAGAAAPSFEDVKVNNGIGYFAGSRGVHIVDVSNPRQPIQLSRIRAMNDGFDEVQNVSVAEDLLFQVNRESSAIKVFDVSDPAEPNWLREIETGDVTGLWDLTIVEDRLYVAGLGGVLGEGATYIFDVENIRSKPPQLIGKLISGSNTGSVWPSDDGRYLVTTQREVGGGLSLWNISNLGFPSQIGHATASTYGIASYSAGAVVVEDNVVYAAWYEAGAQVLDLDALDPDGAPIRIGVYETSLDSSPLDGFVGNRSVYTGLGTDRILLSDTQWGLYVVDATNVLPNPADFDADGRLTIRDLDLLIREIADGMNTAEFDLDGDSNVNTDDLDDWLSVAGQSQIGRPFPVGDANLDGTVNAFDLNDMALNWLQDVAAWSGGDFTADGIVNAADLNALALNWLAAAPTPAAAVPEPSGLALALTCFTLFGFSQRFTFLSQQTQS